MLDCLCQQFLVSCRSKSSLLSLAKDSFVETIKEELSDENKSSTKTADELEEPLPSHQLFLGGLLCDVVRFCLLLDWLGLKQGLYQVQHIALHINMKRSFLTKCNQ